MVCLIAPGNPLVNITNTYITLSDPPNKKQKY